VQIGRKQKRNHATRMAATMDLAFDLSPIPPGERFEFWHDVGSLVHRPVRPSYSTPSLLSVQAIARPFDVMVMGQMASSEQYFQRTERMIKTDHVDSLQLVLLEHGSVRWSAQGNDCHAQTGDLLLLDNDEVTQSAWTAHRQIYAVLPRDLVAAPGWPGPSKRVLQSGSPCAAILSHYLQTIWANRQTESLNSTQQLVQGLASLTRIYFSEAAPLLEAASTPEPIKQTIQRWIHDHLHNPDLDAAQICSAFYLSRSTLYELFKPEGGIRTYLQQCRLERARLILENPNCQASISAIASQLGFRSLSSFSRSFRDHWGFTPRDVKKQVLDTDKASERTTQALDNPIHVEELKKATQRYYRMARATTKP
jgi:AraC-like DNA-binding protein